MPSESVNEDVAARLCAACGMCCDGVMFHSMLLQPGDSARELAALGLKVKRRKAGAFIPQPCTAHQGSCCSIYERRPIRCRVFVCRQLIDVGSGKIGEPEAREKIDRARALTTRVQTLLREVGDEREHKALAARCAMALTPPFESGPDAVRRREDLAAAMSELEAFLAQEFRNPEEPESH